MLKKVSSYFISMLFNVLKRFPMASLMLFLSFLFIVLTNHYYKNIFVRASLQAFIAFPLMIAIQIFSENYIHKRTAFYKILLYIFAIAFNILYFFTLFTKPDKIELIRCCALFIIFTTTVMILLSYKNKNFSVNLIKLTEKFFLSCLYSLVLMLGLMGFFMITQSLLLPDLDYDIMQDIMYFSFIIFAPMFFMAGIPDKNSNNDELKYPLILKFIVKYLAIPFSFGYMVILYLYFAKTLILLTIPKGIIVHIVIWFSIGCFVVLAYISALLKESKSASLYNKIVPKLLIPVLLFMFYSLYLRVSDYGFTESRYFILITGLFLFGVMVYASFAKNIKWKAVFSVLIIVTLVSAFSPFSAFAVSKWSQNNRFEEILKRNNMIVAGKIKPSSKISEKDKSELNSIFNYFDYSYSLKELKLFPKNLKSEDYIKVFGFDISCYFTTAESEYITVYYSSQESSNFIVNSTEFDFMLFFNCMDIQDNQIVENNKYKAVLDKDKQILSIYNKSDNSLVYSFNIIEVVTKKLDEYRKKEEQKTLTAIKTITYTDLTKLGISVEYKFGHISAKYYSKTDTYDGLDFSGLLIKIKLSR